MSLVCFQIAILTGLVAAISALWGGYGIGIAFMAYSLCGAVALVLSLSVFAFLLPARASPATGDVP